MATNFRGARQAKAASSMWLSEQSNEQGNRIAGLLEDCRTTFSNLENDLEWSKTFKSMAASADVVTFDVFDTALTRVTDAPEDVFALVEYRMSGKLNGCKGFAEKREQAELDARKMLAGTGAQDVTFDEIYDAFCVLAGECREIIKEIRAAEIAAEVQALVPVMDILSAVEHVQALGKPVWFVSDMYHSTSTIDQFLKINGFKAPYSLLVSSETRLTKASGDQWTVLKSKIPSSCRVLHIGDNSHSDEFSPKAHGIQTLLYTRMRTNRRSGGPLTSHVLPFSISLRNETVKHHTPTSRDLMARLGRSWGAVVVGGFVEWLEKRASALGLKRLYFLSRDGYLPMAVWNALNLSEKTGIETSYLYVSRRVLQLADAAVPSAYGGLTQRAVNNLAHGGLTAEAMLRRAGLQNCASLARSLQAELGSMEKVISWKSDLKRVREIVSSHGYEVIPQLTELHKRVLGYLRQESIGKEPSAIVDIGWHGTLQAAICELLRTTDENPKLSGFYYGLWPRAKANRPATGWMEAAYGNDFIPLEDQLGLQNAIAILENLHSAGSGTTWDYEMVDGKFRPVLKDSHIENNQHKDLISPFQEAVLESLASNGREDLVSNSYIQEGLAAIQRLSLSPTDEELELLGGIAHSTFFDHETFEPLVPIKTWSNSDLDKIDIAAAEWPIGLHRSIHRTKHDKHTLNELRKRFAYIHNNADPRTRRSLEGTL
jgi:predicted HAD superfamily hydrolase